MKNLKFTSYIILIVLLLALLLTAIIQNIQTVPVKFLFFGISTPVIVIILVSLFIGFLVGLLTCSFFPVKPELRKHSQNRMRKPINKSKRIWIDRKLFD